MDNQERIRTAFERNAKALTLKPSIGQGTAVTRIRVCDGLACTVEEGPWKFNIDMAEKHGGTGTAPNPGVYARAALGGCLAIGYSMWAARRGVPIASLEVEIQADYDGRSEYGVDDSLVPGYLEIRYIVTVESEASEDDVLRVLDEADAHSSILHVFARPQPMRREVRYRRAG